jgi:hypothetical protein
MSTKVIKLKIVIVILIIWTYGLTIFMWGHSSSNSILILMINFFSLAGGVMYHISTPDVESLEGGQLEPDLEGRELEPEPEGGVLVQPKVNLPRTSRAWEWVSSKCLLRTMVDLKLKNIEEFYCEPS